MKNLKYILICLVAISSFTACFKEDDPVPPHVSPPGVETVVAEMLPDYSMQLYYDLQSNSFVKSNNREEWDFSYSCEAGVSAIYLNTSKKVRVANTGSTDWAVPVTLSSVEWLYDESTGEPENTALNNRMEGNVYVLDLGIKTDGSNVGYKKIKFISHTEQAINIEYADFSGSNVKAITLTKDADYNFVYYSVKNDGGQVYVEPKKNEYDLFFTTYVTRVYLDGSTTEFEWYPVTGVLINPNGVSVATDSSDNFTGITFQDLGNYTFSEKRDAIGYEWKVLQSINTGQYTIQTKITYIIRDKSGAFWKLRFVSFTNELGAKGYPKFEVSQF